jgi:MFS family permease
VIAGAAMYAPYGPFFAIIPEMLPRNVAGGAMALINSMGALGSFFGSWFVGYLNGTTGSPSASYIFMGVALFASVWLTLIVKPANNQKLPSALVTPDLYTTEIRMKPSVILYKTLPDDLHSVWKNTLPSLR